MASGERPAAMRASLFGSLSLPARQALSVGYVRENGRGGSGVDVATLGYSLELASRLSLSIAAFRSFRDLASWSVGLSLAYALDARRFVSGGVSRNNARSEAVLQLQQGLPTATGFGYDVRAGTGGSGSYGARLLYQNDYGNYGIEAGRAGDQLGVSANVSGGVVAMGGHTMLSRRVHDSFAMVEVGGVPGVDVYSNNQHVATTDSAGVALIPNLHAYQRNVLRLDERGVPVEVELDLAERTIAPYARSGALVSFKAARIDGATLRILTEDHAWMPLGSEVRVGHAAAIHRVAQRGEVFLAQISYPATVRVATGGRSCSFTVPAPANDEPLPRLGPFKCRASAP
jgi:outer membrane usher protein